MYKWIEVMHGLKMRHPQGSIFENRVRRQHAKEFMTAGRSGGKLRPFSPGLFEVHAPRAANDPSRSRDVSEALPPQYACLSLDL
jgi:hypothetical protein